MKRNVTASAKIDYFKDLTDLQNQAAADLCELALNATQSAYAPYSTYHVGVAVKLVDGTIITGNNQENAVYPLGLCAERVAIYAATSQYPDNAIKEIAIATLKELQTEELPAFPCGSCRQVMVEMENRFATPITLYIVGQNKAVCVVQGARQLLPFTFDAASL